MPPRLLVPVPSVESAAHRGGTDVELACALQEGQTWAVTETWRRFAPMVLSFAARALGSVSEAEDLAQEVFYRVFRKAKGLRDPASLRSFIFSFALRLLKTELRHRRARRWLAFQPSGTLPEIEIPSADLESLDLLRRFYALLERLGTRERMVFSLRHLERMTVEEIATNLDISESTVKRALGHATKRLSHWIEMDFADLERARIARGLDGEERSMSARHGSGQGQGDEESTSAQRVVAELADLARDMVGPPTPSDLERGLRRLTTRLGAPQRKPLRRLWWTAAAATSLALALLFSRRLFTDDRPATTSFAALDYDIRGGHLVDGGYLREEGHAGMKLAFAEGTTFSLPSGTRGRLRSVDPTGARIAIEQGTASFEVTPRPGARWLVDVGPFLVTVKGTSFTVAWDPTRERFELRLFRGRVAVTGPLSGPNEIALDAGHRLVVDLPHAETVITALDDERNPGAPARPAPDVRPETRGPSAGAAPSGTASRRTQATTPSPAPEQNWPSALATGELDLIIDDVSRTGLTTTLQHASEGDLFALADAARYRRRTTWARESLLTVRRRFPASARTAEAAYLLGRVEETTGNQTGEAEALKWYGVYLTAAPHGDYASEALGRRMTLISHGTASAKARALADEYLRRFPQGTYAGAARALQSAP